MRYRGPTSPPQEAWQIQLTAMPSTASSPSPTADTFAIRLLKIYQECMANGSWARVIFAAYGGLETLSSLLLSAASPPVPVPSFWCDCLASEKRFARDRRAVGVACEEATTLTV